MPNMHGKNKFIATEIIIVILLSFSFAGTCLFFYQYQSANNQLKYPINNVT